MKPPAFEYVRPATVSDAVASLAAAGGDGKVLAGGQSLVPLLNFRLASPSVLVDMNGVDGLDGIERHGDRLRIGAMTRMRRLETDPLVREAVPLLAAAASWVGHVQIRNRGTVGGSIAHADPAAEIPAVCVLLDAELTAIGPAGSRRIAANDFFAGFLTTDLADDEVLTEIELPIPGNRDRWGFREFAPRHGDFALAGATVLITTRADDLTESGRIVVFGTDDRPVRSPTAEALLSGQRLTREVIERAGEAAAQEALADDARPDQAYRRILTATMVRRALEDAAALDPAR
jgi:aerobic carbon-monoxide dehydrogenase medium subunit